MSDNYEDQNKLWNFKFSAFYVPLKIVYGKSVKAANTDASVGLLYKTVLSWQNISEKFKTFLFVPFF